MTRSDKHRMMRLVQQSARRVLNMWGVGLGIPLVTRFYSEDPWITAKELAVESGTSEDTVRRRLEELVNIDRVRVARRGRTTVYKARKELADKTFRELKSLVSAAKCV